MFIIRQPRLPCEAGFEETLDLCIVCGAFRIGLHKRMGVPPRLQLAWDDLGRIRADERGGGFKLDVQHEPGGEDVAVWSPGALLSSVAGQRDQSLAAVAGDSVRIEQHADCAWAGKSFPGFPATDCGCDDLTVCRSDRLLLRKSLLF